jgi:TolA-binding protein
MAVRRGAAVAGTSSADQQLAEVLNQLTGAAGKKDQRAVRVSDLVSLGVLTVDGANQLRHGPAWNKLSTQAAGALSGVGAAGTTADQLQTELDALSRKHATNVQAVADAQAQLDVASSHIRGLQDRLGIEQSQRRQLMLRLARNEQLAELLRQDTQNIHTSLAMTLENTSNVDNIPHGTTYGRVANTDLVDVSLTRRLGLRVAGSGHRIGDQRNLPQSIATAYGSVRSTDALTADSSGNVSVNAHSARYGSVSVSYAAVTNAVTGLTVNTTYVIYCHDAGYAGGTRTWYAAADPDAAMQQGDDVVVAGQIKIPAAGTANGGSGSGGGNFPPGRF